VNGVVQAAIRIAGPHLRGRVSLTTELREVPDVLGDEGKLVQLLVNPIVNAAQAMAERGGAHAAHLRVESRVTPDGEIEISIADTGPGFDPAILPRLGEPYVTSRRESGGTGLGLFLTHGLVTEHHGTLLLENREGGGAIVRIRLPVIRDDVERLRDALHSPAPSDAGATAGR
jgi:signal transduction histidine kinase